MDRAYINPLIRADYLVLVFAALVLAGGFLAWRTAGKCRLRLRLLMTLTRMFALACLGIVALNPGAWREMKEDKDTEWAVLIDRSRSMATADVGGKARWNEGRRIARKALALARDADGARLYAFADQINAISADALADAEADGPATDILQACRNCLTRARSSARVLTGMILVSDGRQVSKESYGDVGLLARSQECAIYALPVGGRVARRDLSVRPARRQYVAFTGQKLKVNAVLKAENLGKISPVVALLTASGEKRDEHRVDLTDGTPGEAGFELLCENEGHYGYELRVPKWEGETVDSNNSAEFGVTVLGSKMQVFVAEGVPCWDTKFLVQLLREQPNMEVTTVYRLSADRFFKVDTDPSRTFEAAEAIFPDDAAEISQYDVIVLGKGMEYFLTPARIALLRQFVVEQGGCILFARGKPYSASFPELEALEPAVWSDSSETDFRLRPTIEGREAGLFGEMLPDIDAPIWSSLPALSGAQQCAKLKSFTTVLAEGLHEGDTRTRALPVIFTMRYGRGMALVVNGGEMWQWAFFPSVADTSATYQELWAQLLQWAVTYSEFLPGQKHSLRLSESSVLPGTPVRIGVSLRSGAADESGVEPLLIIRRGEEVIQELKPVSTPADRNRWEAVFSAELTGMHVVELAGKGIEQGPRKLLQVRPRPDESDDLSADIEFLTKLAEESGGRLISEDELENVVQLLQPEREVADLSKAVWVPMWDKWWMLALIVFFFGIEWFLRRRNGLL